MLNFLIGSPATIEDRACIQTRPGVDGHAVYGDYLDYPAGRYAVEFDIAPAPGQSFRRDLPCAEIDVVAGNDTRLLAKRTIMLSDLRKGPRRFVLDFRIAEPARLQFRVGVTGSVPLTVDDHRPVARLADDDADIAAAIDAIRFPDPAALGAPAFLRDHAGTLRSLFDRGIGVAVAGNDVVLRAGTVSFLARTHHDLNFVGEIFFDNTYNIDLPDETCVIDIGMNSGLVSLQMAARAAVKEIHSFEPFADTYARAQANLAINPELAGKITTYNVGLSDRDEAGEFIVPDMGDSGAMTIRRIGHGIPVQLDIRDAATMLRPIIDAAVERDRRVVMKVDCEGSEFAIFASLEGAGLLNKVSAFMVEWHRVYDGKSQADLIEPLRRRGFITFDRSPAIGNGFFYAVRSG